MKSKYLLFFLFLLLTSNLYSNNRVLIITNDNVSYNNYKTLIDNNSDKIPYDIEIVNLEDDLINNIFTPSENYLKNRWSDPPLFTYYITNTPKKRVMIYGFNSQAQPNLEIIKILLKKLFLESRISKEFPLFITKILPEKEIIKLYRDSGYNIILLEGINNPTTIVETLYTQIDKQNVSTHYFIMPFFGKTIYLEAKILLIFNGISVFIIILLLNIYSKRLNFHLRHNRKYLMTIPIKVISLFIFYFISTLILEYVETLSGGSNIVLSYPGTFFLLKHLILFFIYGICFQVIKDVSISKSPYFYANFSLYGSLLVYLILAVIYLPLALYQLWPISLTILFIISRSRQSKRFFLVLSPIFMALLFYNFLNSDFLVFSELMLKSRYIGNIILTIILAPYIFLQESFFRFTHRKQNKINYAKDIVLSLLTITITFTTIAILLELNIS